LMREDVWSHVGSGFHAAYKADNGDKEPEKPASKQQKEQTYEEKPKRVMKGGVKHCIMHVRVSKAFQTCVANEIIYQTCLTLMKR